MVLVQCDTTIRADKADAKEQIDLVKSVDRPFRSEGSDQLIIGDPFLADEEEIIGRTTKYHRTVVVDSGVCTGIRSIGQEA